MCTVAFQYDLTNMSTTAFGSVKYKFEPSLTGTQSANMLMEQLFLSSKYLMYICLDGGGDFQIWMLTVYVRISNAICNFIMAHLF